MGKVLEGNTRVLPRSFGKDEEQEHFGRAAPFSQDTHQEEAQKKRFQV